MALVVNGVDIPNGADLFVDGVQVQSIEVDGIPVWGLTEAPGTVDDFSASDDQYGQVEVNWTPTTGLPSPHYDLYRDGILIAEKIQPGYVDVVIPGTYTYYIIAYNSDGSTTSNYDDGTSLVPVIGDVTIDYNSVSGSNPETVTGSNGSFTFTPPEGVTEVEVCMIGGGGSGSIGGTKQYFGACYVLSNGYGGYAGQIVNQNVSVTPGTPVTVTIGRGGASVPEDTNMNAGNPGSPTSFGSLTASGGAGGDFTIGGSGYKGNGGSRSTCAGSFNDGTSLELDPYMDEGSLWGGQAGLGKGGNSPKIDVAPENGGPGSGGGCGAFEHTAGCINYWDSGAGGDGRVILKWD